MRRHPVAFALALLSACGRSHTAPLDVGPSPVGVIVESRVVYYDVTAASLGELRRAMREQGPRWEGQSHTAVTRSRFRWTWQSVKRGTNACELRQVKVRVSTVVTFPRWNPSGPPDSATMEWWQQMNAGLAEHERGHALLSVKAAGELVRKLEGMSQVQCDALGTQANMVARRHVDESQRKQEEYDATTRHGATQIRQAARLREP